jgi:hypothetical protein
LTNGAGEAIIPLNLLDKLVFKRAQAFASRILDSGGTAGGSAAPLIAVQTISNGIKKKGRP